MTDSIKPPGSGAPPAAVIPSGGLDRATGVAPAGATASATTAAGANGPAAILAEQLKAGTLSPAQVIDAVVTRALDSARAQGLPATERDNLEATLRAALVGDPTLASLGRELER